MENRVSIRQWIKNFEAGKYVATDVHTQIEAGWYDWFCKDSSLANKTQKLGKKLMQIANSSKINQDTMYVFFKNNCPVVGSLYDDFRICDMKTGDVIFTITPSSGFKKNKGKAEIWGKENNFEGPILEGTWTDIKKWFLS